MIFTPKSILDFNLSLKEVEENCLGLRPLPPLPPFPLGFEPTTTNIVFGTIHYTTKPMLTS